MRATWAGTVAEPQVTTITAARGSGAQACRRDPAWVSARLQAGVIEAQGPRAGVYYFTSSTLVRARRIAHLETTFDADPHLAALAADLMEEVAALRQRLAQLEHPSAQAH